MCRFNCLCFVGVVGLLGPLGVVVDTIAAAERTEVRCDAANAAEVKIHKELDSTTEVEFFDTPLTDIMQFLEDYHGLQIEIDAPALEEIGLSTDHPITRSLQGIKLRSALKLILEPIDLCWEIRDEVLMITSIDKATERKIIRVYDVADLLGDDSSAEELIEVVRAAFPEKADEGASATPFHHLLIVRDSQHGHEQIQRLLAEMRKLMAKPKAAAATPEPISVDSSDPFSN